MNEIINELKHFKVQNLQKFYRFLCIKIKRSNPVGSTDLDRQTLDADADPDPAKRCRILPDQDLPHCLYENILESFF
jgi:hypothetical protein